MRRLPEHDLQHGDRAEVWTRKDLLYNGAKGAANEGYVLFGSLSNVYLLAH